jgi:hypoxanthine phosphoribosyltransferase
MERNREKTHIQTWREYSYLVEDLKQQILEKGRQYRFITGVPRGGLVLATTLSHQLGLEYKPFERVDLSVYQNNMFDKNAYTAFTPDNMLIVDDICDSGNTLKMWDEMGFDIAVCYLRLPFQFKPKFFASTVETEWVEFAWENNLV